MVKLYKIHFKFNLLTNIIQIRIKANKLVKIIQLFKIILIKYNLKFNIKVEFVVDIKINKF